MPKYKLIEICNQYKNKDGYIDFKNITYIAEFFGVSFQSCVFKIAYSLNLIDGDISPDILNKRISKYKPDKKKKELIKNSNDSKLIENIINSLYYVIINLNENTSKRFLDNYIYHDNKIEGIEQKK